MMETMNTPEKRTYSSTTMNTKRYFIYAAALVLMAACQAEKEAYIEETAPQTTEQKVVAPEITAVQESGNDTKSVLDVDGEGVGTIYWTPADEINVFYGTTSTHYVSQNAVNATTAVFTTTDVIGSTESASENIWGLYPYNSSATCTGSAVTTTLPATQYGVPGTFDEDLFITLAHNTTTALKFYNVCGGIKFSLSRDDITEITFRGNNNEDIAGDISLDFVDSKPRVTVTDGEKTITITPKVGSTFTADEDYYIVLLPGNLTSGFTMTFEATDGSTGTFNYTDKAVTIKRSVFGKKTDIDTYAFFRIPIPDNQIWYTTRTGTPITTRDSRNGDDNIILSNAFGGATIVSNVYSEGKGIITFDNPVASIDKEAFKQCSNLTSIVLPNSIETIGLFAFELCEYLESVYIPYGVTTISMGALSRCFNLETIYFPDSITTIGSNCLYYDRNLNSVRLPRGLTTISSGLFYLCSSLTEIPLPDGITTISSQAFALCSSLGSFTIPEAVTVISNNMFSDCSALSSVTLHDGITTIDDFAFRNCVSLSSIDIPDSVTEIGWCAFTGCTGFTTLSFPSGVENVGKEAFTGCTGLSSIVFNSVTPPVGGTDMFEDTNNCPIYVPAGSVDDYKAAENWSTYSDRIFAIGE